MKSSSRPSSASSFPCASRWQAIVAAVLGASAVCSSAQTTALADAPPLATYSVPGNVVLVTSVEFPTANTVAYTSRTYVAATQYQGYFDPEKCYQYSYDTNDTPATPNAANPNTYYTPVGAASNHLCNVGSATGQWSGNFMNWAAMQTIDTFRSVLTGGYRVIDNVGLTVLEKAWATGDGGTGDFPDSSLAAADIAGATPLGALAAGSLQFRIQGLGNVMRFIVASGARYTVKYYNSTDLSGAVAATDTVYDGSAITDNTSPHSGVNTYYYSAQYTTTVVAPTTGSYTFATYSDDGARMYINGSATPIIDNWPSGGQSATLAQSAPISLTAGQSVAVTVNYRQFGGGATLGIGWILPGSTTLASLGAAAPASLYAGSTNFSTATGATRDTAYDIFVRAKVCDGNANFDAIESALCTVYGSNAKPEGLLQKYNKKLRFSGFGYLNDNSLLRDGGVLRAAQKYIGPMKYAYGLPDATNPAAEWSATTGVFTRNPDTSDASASNVMDSGVINYLNKFGELCLPLGAANCGHSYKTYDPVSELYYAAIRYLKNVGNVPEWSALPVDATAQAKMKDGFPVITNWTDPIQDWCQKNFILGIGDTGTHADKNVTGATPIANEPTKPQAVVNDTNSARSPTDAVTATNQVGLMEANYATASGTSFSPATTGSLGTTNPWGCCDNNSALMAGLAYDSHTTDIRNDILTKPVGSKVTVDTYWVDVQEGQSYRPNNQFYLAAKYGGFTVPSGFAPYTATVLPPESSWWNNIDVDPVSGQKRPTNYFPGNSPQAMRAGLGKAFASIVSAAGAVNSTTFLTPLPQIASAGTSSFAARYDSSSWTGDVVGSTLVINSNGTTTSTPGGDFQANLDAQTTRRIATWSPTRRRGVEFQSTVGTASGSTVLDSLQLAALDTDYVTGNDSVDYLAYLRGDRSKEPALGTPPNATTPYRARAHLLGDIVDSRPTAVGPPSFPFSDSSNPGYNAFKTGSAASRPTVVYVGANDGMLHAIDGRLATSTAAANGSELFAYVPNALFSGPNGTSAVDGLISLGNPNFNHHNMVDATASDFDVDFNRTTDGTSAPPATWAPDWHTILIGGLGKGGKAFYALDVTDPTAMSQSEVTLAAKVLWEFTDPNMGYSYGEPAVAKTKKYGWTVILSSGYNTADGKGHLYFLNPKTGALLETVDMPPGSSGLTHFDGFVVDSTDDTVDAIYAGDLQGNVWRVDVTPAFVGSGTRFAAPLLLAKLTDGSNSPAPQPITTRPKIAVDPSIGNQNSGDRYVLVGTGRLLDSSDIGTVSMPGQTQSFYSIIDGTNATFNATAAQGVTFPITRAQLANATSTTTSQQASAAVLANPAGWYVDLIGAQSGSALRVLHDATVDVGRISFAATLPVGSACAPGGVSQDYGFDFGTGQSVLVNTSGNLIAYQSVGYDVTDMRFISVNGVAMLLYGGGGNVLQQPTAPNTAAATRRINWREVPITD